MSAWYFGSVWPAASASFTRTSIASPFSACTITSAPVSAATCIVRKSVSSSTISAPLYAMKSLYDVMPWSGSVASSSSVPPSFRSVTAMW